MKWGFRGNGVVVCGDYRLRCAKALVESGHLDMLAECDGFVLVKPRGTKLRKDAVRRVAALDRGAQ